VNTHQDKSKTSGPIPRIAVLGAGPAGTTAALDLARAKLAEVDVLELRDTAGGNAGSFRHEGMWCDFGSHRLHPAAEEKVLGEIKSLLGDDLLWRPRHGRILLKGRWIHFPLKPLDLLLGLPKSFIAGLMLDMLRKPFMSAGSGEENFETVLRRGLGPTMSESFYFPYVRKLWGLDPSELAVTLAKRRVSGSSITKVLQKITRQIPGIGSSTAGGFYYPREGFGQISRALQSEAVYHGAKFSFGARVTAIERDGARVTGVHYEEGGEERHQSVDAVWSTLPLGLLVRSMRPAAPDHVLAAADAIRSRGMILIYLVLEQAQFTEFDAHYFPELSIPISRLSEPKNYSASVEPRDCTVLCAELPSDPDEPEWALSDEELGQRMCAWLGDAGLPVNAPVREVMTRRLGQAYPVYDRDFEKHFAIMDGWIASLDGLLTFGRQGLFAHDNTHHAMAMAYAATECLGPDGEFDETRWARYRIEFESHVVED
jgi:protoporphyrinogen oxidase